MRWLARRTARSLRARVAAVAAATILLAVVVFGAVTILLVGHELRASLDSGLRQRAQEVAQLAVSTPAVLTQPGALESPLSGRQVLVEVIDARGRIVARSLSLGAELLPQDALARSARLHGDTGAETIVLGGRPLRMYAAPIASGLGPLGGGAVLVASDTADITHTTSRLGLLIALIGAGIALLAAAAAAALTRRGLRPLRCLADAAGEIERTADSSRRLPDAGAVDEVGRLTGVLNRMLASLQRAQASERRFLADASHELRTPVTALLGNVDYATRHGADPEVLADLAQDAGRLARLVDQLLALERAAAPGGAGARAQIAADQLARDVAAEDDSGRVRLGRLDPVVVVADREALARALRNLVRNGLLHGPDGGAVTISVQRQDDRVQLSVCDEGTGPPVQLHERLFERFWRGPGAAAHTGSGLGLSIVAAVAAAHGGEVSVRGSRFAIELPLAGSP